MWEKNQLTLKKETSFSGIGLHSGINVKVTLEPANSNSGIVFRRTDLETDNEIVANFKNVSSAKLCTKIQNSSGASVSTIEHLMAAFYICGIDNIIVNLNGPEIPIMDGSAKDFVKIIKDSGFKVLEGKRKFVRIKNKIELKTEDGKLIKIKPSPARRAAISIKVIAISAVQSLKTSGVLVTQIPNFSALGKSI